MDTGWGMGWVGDSHLKYVHTNGASFRSPVLRELHFKSCCSIGVSVGMCLAGQYISHCGLRQIQSEDRQSSQKDNTRQQQSSIFIEHILKWQTVTKVLHREINIIVIIKLLLKFSITAFVILFFLVPEQVGSICVAMPLLWLDLTEIWRTHRGNDLLITR